MLFADQDAIFRSTTKKKILPRIYNEQSKFNKKDTIIPIKISNMPPIRGGKIYADLKAGEIIVLIIKSM